MKNLTIPIDHLVMLAELDDKDAGLMAKAIAQYANKGIVPSFSNSALKAIFSLFRSIIDAQRESSAKRSEINTTNAMGKKSAAKKKAAKRAAKSIRPMPWARSRLQRRRPPREQLQLIANRSKSQTMLPKRQKQLRNRSHLMQSKRYIRNSVLIATNRSPFGNPSTKRRSVKPSISFKPTSVKRLTPLTRCI